MIPSVTFAGSTVAAASMRTARAAIQPGMAAGKVTGRYANALQLLSISSVWTRSGGESAGPLSGGRGPGGSDLASIAATYANEMNEAASDFPGSSKANQRHIAQYNTIMEHRTDFPPGEFYIHTELGDGASITTRIPPVGETKPPPSKIEVKVTSLLIEMSGAEASVAVETAHAAYAQWM